MFVLALDLSTKTGYALLEGEPGNIPRIIETGLLTNSGPVSSYGEFPWSYVNATKSIAEKVLEVVARLKPDLVVIENTNLGRARYSQKTLEFIHLHVLLGLADKYPVVYINSSDWRRKLGATLTKEDKSMNTKVRKLKKSGDKKGLQELGVRGRIGKKHVAVRYVNSTFNLQLKLKDNDIADATCQGVAWFLGAPVCDGK
jgi:Holliday junction resolvasome RuvABC endonuclease subunit